MASASSSYTNGQNPGICLPEFAIDNVIDPGSFNLFCGDTNHDWLEIDMLSEHVVFKVKLEISN